MGFLGKKRWALLAWFIVTTNFAFGCRIVCSHETGLWHMLADGDSEKFQLVHDSETLHQRMDCNLLPERTPPLSPVDEKAEEENRLINHCTLEGSTAQEKKIFRTERQTTRRIGMQGTLPSPQLEESLVWVWETHRTDPKNGRTVVQETKRVTFARNDCGSAEAR